MMLAARLADCGIQLSSYDFGSRKTTCPQCSAQRSNKTDPCLSVTIDDRGAVWRCHHCGWKGALAERARLRTLRAPPVTPKPFDLQPLPPEADAWFTARCISPDTLRRTGVAWSRRWIPSKAAEVECIAFPYRRRGEIVNVKFRTLDKEFAQIKNCEKVFYLGDLVDHEHGDRLVIVEGEIDALSLLEAGVNNVVSVPDGAPAKVKHEIIDLAGDRKFSYVWSCPELINAYPRIVLATDADPPGRALAEELARRIGPERCRVVIWPEGCNDANDVLVRHGPAALAACIEQGQPYQSSDGAANNDPPPIGADLAAALQLLAKLSPMEYDRCRKDEAARLDVRLGTLDAAVRRLRGMAEPVEGGGAVTLDDPEPWPEPVAGVELLDALADAALRHLVLPAGGADATALWIVHAHAQDTTGISPILAVTSPTPECGKTTLLTLLGALVPRPLPASNITAAALFRAVERWTPSLLVDEADTFMADSDELRGVINSGHSRGTAWVIRTVGDNHEPRRFATWAPKAIALIGRLPATLESRAVHIELRRIAEGEHVDRLRPDQLGHFEPLRRKAWRWARDNSEALRGADPEMPAALRGRNADNWRHLLAIADVAGGHWPQKARLAAEALCAGRSERTAAVMLLEDLRALFVERRVDRLSSAEIVEALGGMEERPWSEWKAGKPITPRQLAKLLEPFKVSPATTRFPAGVSKGYRLDQFDEPFRRYLPMQPVTPLQARETADFGSDPSVTVGPLVTDRKCPNAKESAACDGVTDVAEESEGETAQWMG